MISVARPENLFAVAGVLDRAVANGQNVSPFFGVYNQPTRARLLEAVNTLSGEAHTAAGRIGVQTSDQFLRVLLDDHIDAGKTDEPGIHLWASVFGRTDRVDGDAGNGSSRLSASDENIAIGASFAANPALRFGAAISGGQGGARLTDISGRAEADILQVGVFGRYDGKSVSLRASGSWSMLDIETDRAVPALAINSLRSNYDITAWGGRLEAALHSGPLTGSGLSPFAALQIQSVKIPGFDERDATTGAASGVTSTGVTNITSRSELGATWEHITASTRLFARAAWAYSFTQETNFSARLIGLAGSDFTIRGALTDDHAAILTAGGDYRITRRIAVGTTLDGTITGNANSFAGSVKLRVGF